MLTSIPPAPLQPIYTRRYTGHTISTDLLGCFAHEKYVLTIDGHLSRQLELYPLTDTTFCKVLKCVLRCITTCDRLSVILSDLGLRFTSRV